MVPTGPFTPVRMHSGQAQPTAPLTCVTLNCVDCSTSETEISHPEVTVSSLKISVFLCLRTNGKCLGRQSTMHGQVHSVTSETELHGRDGVKMVRHSDGLGEQRIVEPEEKMHGSPTGSWRSQWQAECEVHHDDRMPPTSRRAGQSSRVRARDLKMQFLGRDGAHRFLGRHPFVPFSRLCGMSRWRGPPCLSFSASSGALFVWTKVGAAQNATRAAANARRGARHGHLPSALPREARGAHEVHGVLDDVLQGVPRPPAPTNQAPRRTTLLRHEEVVGGREIHPARTEWASLDLINWLMLWRCCVQTLGRPRLCTTMHVKRARPGDE